MKKESILIADDNPDNLQVLKKLLIGLDYEVRIATNGKFAVKSAQTEKPDLILMDIHMPEMNGYEACIALKKDIRTREIPLLFVSALNEQFNRVKGFELGAVDYLTKPIEKEELCARVQVHLKIRRQIVALEEFNKIMLNREMRVIELKQEVNSISLGFGQKAPYPEVREENP